MSGSMRILVTGGAGFIGSHVTDGYLKLGHTVAVVDDLSRGFRGNVNPRAEFYEGDIRDLAFLETVFSEFQPEIVNHHAAQMDVRRGVREPIFDAGVNILGSLNLLQQAVTHKTRHIIYISTAGAAYGEPKHLPVSEDCPVNPITPYGISKHTVEHYLFTFSYLCGTTYVVLRYGNVYGPRQNSQGEAGVFAIFSEQILGGVSPVIYGDGSKLRDYVYVDDVVAANIVALDHGYGEIFNIASGIPTSDDEVLRLVKDILCRPDVQARHTPKRPGEIDAICLDISKAREKLNWKPEVPLSVGARLAVDYFRAAATIARSA